MESEIMGDALETIQEAETVPEEQMTTSVTTLLDTEMTETEMTETEVTTATTEYQSSTLIISNVNVDRLNDFTYLGIFFFIFCILIIAFKGIRSLLSIFF